jgi:ParB/RepB/Spo0J family partition protein
MTTTADFQSIPLEQLAPSKHNPRKHFDPTRLDELTASIKEKGVLQPLLVRPNGTRGYEIVAGERRYRAAKAAGLTEIPAIVRQLNDTEVVECQTIENLQREDVHPLEEAAGYHALMKLGKYDAARIAARVGRSVKYVYDRMKLLELSKEAQDLFWKGKIQAGHAILLARLSPADQKRALDTERGGMFQHEQVLFTDEQEATLEDLKPEEYALERVKPVTVRELAGWIDQHVRFHPDKADTFLFPESTGAVKEATEQHEKIVPITHNHFVPPELKDTRRVYCTTSWTRADGKYGTKPCPRSILGVVVVGPERGEAFKVCLDKKGCKVHWAQYQKEAARRQTGQGGEGSSYAAQLEKERERRAAEAAQEQEDEKRWDKARPVLLKALAVAVKKAPARATGLLAKIVLESVARYGSNRKAEAYVPRGRTAEDFVRHAAFTAIYQDSQTYFKNASRVLLKIGRALNVDLKKILNELAS